MPPAAKTVVVVELKDVYQESQIAGGPRDHMIGKIACRVFYRDEPLETHCTVKQVTGSDFREQNNIEVSRPVGYTGPFDWDTSRAADAHYRRAVGPSASGIRITGGSNITMTNTRINVGTTTVTMECDESGGGTW